MHTESAAVHRCKNSRERNALLQFPLEPTVLSALRARRAGGQQERKWKEARDHRGQRRGEMENSSSTSNRSWCTTDKTIKKEIETSGGSCTDLSQPNGCGAVCQGRGVSGRKNDHDYIVIRRLGMGGLRNSLRFVTIVQFRYESLRFQSVSSDQVSPSIYTVLQPLTRVVFNESSVFCMISFCINNRLTTLGHAARELAKECR